MARPRRKARSKKPHTARSGAPDRRRPPRPTGQRPRSSPSPTRPDDGGVRLNRYLASAGLCSRRAADEVIQEGRITIDGQIVLELGVRVFPDKQDIRFDGKRLKQERRVYVAFNKPLGVVCTNAEDEKRPRVIDCLPSIKGRLFTVGRLDADSKGLILVTNDGDFAQAVAHPRNGVEKTYEVMVKGRVEGAALQRVRKPMVIDGSRTRGAHVTIRQKGRDRTFLIVSLQEGKNREIRRMFARVGHPVTSLRRTRIGSLELKGLGEGRHRFLEEREIRSLMGPPRPANEG